jgi:hypothetical protein
MSLLTFLFFLLDWADNEDIYQKLISISLPYGHVAVNMGIKSTTVAPILL